MKLLQLNTPTENSSKRRCNHPLAVVVDPTDGEICELEAMLAKCPNCSRWLPGDGPIMAVLSSDENNIHPDPKNLRDSNPNRDPSSADFNQARRDTSRWNFWANC